MDHEVQLPWSNFLEIIIYKAFGPLTRCKSNVDQDDHAPKSECVSIFNFNICPKKANLKKNPSLTILLSSLGLHLSSLLVKCVEDVDCKSSHNNLYKKMSDLICTCSM